MGPQWDSRWGIPTSLGATNLGDASDVIRARDGKPAETDPNTKIIPPRGETSSPVATGRAINRNEVIATAELGFDAVRVEQRHLPLVRRPAVTPPERVDRERADQKGGARECDKHRKAPRPHAGNPSGAAGRSARSCRHKPRP